MIELGDGNFSQCFGEVERAIRASSFIAVDLEFLGLPSSRDARSISLFDSPAERYVKLRESVKKFPPCQLGLACFREVGNSFKVDVFTIHLFKRLCKRVFSFSLSALTFLSKNNFDFNKFISEGVTYLNRNEFARIKREIVNDTFDFDNLTDNLENRLQMLKMRILLEATVDDEPIGRESESAERASFCRDGRVRLCRPLLIELCAKEDNNEGDLDTSGTENDAMLWDSPLTAVEAAAVVHVLGQEFPYFDFQLDQSRTLLYVAEIPLIFRNSAERRRQKSSLKILLNELFGVSRLFQVISEAKKPLVGHNSLLDFLYIYHYFEADLPETYDGWKAAMTTTFSTLIDTRVLAVTLQDQLSSHGVADFSLQTLGHYFDSPSCGSILPFESPQVIPDAATTSKLAGGAFYHNAGFDALVTGKVFIKIVHLYAYSKCSSPELARMPWPFQKLLIVLKSRVTNRIPIPLIDNQHCYLNGEDPMGQRPDIIQVRRRRHVELPLLKYFEDVVSSLAQHWLPPLEVSEEECYRLQDDLSRVLGSFRVEVRTNGVELLLATNTAKSFARVCSFFAAHEDYCLTDSLSNTYEQRLTASREKKDVIPSGARRQTTMFYVSVAGVFVIFVAWKRVFVSKG